MKPSEHLEKILETSICNASLNQPTIQTNKPNNSKRLLKWSPLPYSTFFASNRNPKNSTYVSKRVNNDQRSKYHHSGKYHNCCCSFCFPPLRNETVMPQLLLSQETEPDLSTHNPKRQYPFQGVVSDAATNPSIKTQTPHRSTWSKYYRKNVRVFPVLKPTVSKLRKGRSRTGSICKSSVAPCKVIKLSQYSLKKRPRLSGRPRPPRPIRPGCGSQDRPGRSTNQRPEPSKLTSRTKPRKPSPHKNQPTSTKPSFFRLHSQNTLETSFPSSREPARQQPLFLSKKRVKKKGGCVHCGFSLRTPQSTSTENQSNQCYTLNYIPSHNNHTKLIIRSSL